MVVYLKLFKHCLNYIVNEVSPLITHQYSWTSFTSVSSTHLVKYFITVIIYLAFDILVGGLIGPTKSISHLSNTCKVTCGLSGISSLPDGFPTL
jgi:hypothetical protein